jgi:hypothetical protein
LRNIPSQDVVIFHCYSRLSVFALAVLYWNTCYGEVWPAKHIIVLTCGRELCYVSWPSWLQGDRIAHQTSDRGTVFQYIAARIYDFYACVLPLKHFWHSCQHRNEPVTKHQLAGALKLECTKSPSLCEYHAYLLLDIESGTGGQWLWSYFIFLLRSISFPFSKTNFWATWQSRKLRDKPLIWRHVSLEGQNKSGTVNSSSKNDIPLYNQRGKCSLNFI